MKLEFYRFNDAAIIPKRSHVSDTGADIKMIKDGSIAPLETLVIPLGFGIEVPKGYSARLQVRTSIARQGIHIQGCAIDAGYTGEISMIIHNLSLKDFTWKKGDRLGYIEFYQILYPEFIENLSDERGNNSFGSTGK